MNIVDKQVTLNGVEVVLERYIGIGSRFSMQPSLDYPHIQPGMVDVLLVGTIKDVESLQNKEIRDAIYAEIGRLTLCGGMEELEDDISLMEWVIYQHEANINITATSLETFIAHTSLR